MASTYRTHDSYINSATRTEEEGRGREGRRDEGRERRGQGVACLVDHRSEF